MPAPHANDVDQAGTVPSASVAVVTYERPAFVSRCLDHLLAQTVPPLEIIVVDSSMSAATAQLVKARYPTVAYEVCPAGRGATATARDIAYRRTGGAVLAFVDDDAFAEPDWLEKLLAPYADRAVGGVGGRQIRQQAGEIEEGVDAIGLLLSDGVLTGNFTADPGRPMTVDHLLGANMSFRRSALDRIGGIRDGYAGTCIREETDLCLQVAHAGYRLVYTPDAVVEHLAGPYAKGQRFDLRYAYWTQKNHLILLIRNFGATDPKVRGFLATSMRRAAHDTRVRLKRVGVRAVDRDPRGALRAAGAVGLRVAVLLAGSVTGIYAGLLLARSDRRS